MNTAPTFCKTAVPHWCTVIGRFVGRFHNMITTPTLSIQGIARNVNTELPDKLSGSQSD